MGCNYIFSWYPRTTDELQIKQNIFLFIRLDPDPVSVYGTSFHRDGIL